jgi:hypothetical protein
MAAGAPQGNTNAAKGKLFYDQLRKIAIQQPDKLRQVAEGLFAAAEAMEPWAVKELLDRLDGKAVQQTELTGAEGAPLLSGIQVTFVKPQHE